LCDICTVDLTRTSFKTFKFLTFIFAVLLLLMYLWFTCAVLQASCENKSTTTRTTRFMVRTEEGSVLYLYKRQK